MRWLAGWLGVVLCSACEPQSRLVAGAPSDATIIAINFRECGTGAQADFFPPTELPTSSSPACVKFSSCPEPACASPEPNGLVCFTGCRPELRACMVAASGRGCTDKFCTNFGRALLADGGVISPGATRSWDFSADCYVFTVQTQREGASMPSPPAYFRHDFSQQGTLNVP